MTEKKTILKDPSKKDKIVWNQLSKNPSAIHLIEAALKDPLLKDKIDWDYLSLNPNIFKLNTLGVLSELQKIF